MGRITSVHDYVASKPNWADSILLLREILLGTNVNEHMKWSAPAYTHNGENIIGLLVFKEYVGLWFHQGVFLNDSAKVLINANESKTKGLRQWRFSNLKEIEENALLIVEYVNEAIENQKAGKKIKVLRAKPLSIPEELKRHLEGSSSLKDAFDGLIRGKRVEFADYISEAKQAKTKLTRLKKITPMILRGEGLNDKYKP